MVYYVRELDKWLEPVELCDIANKQHLALMKALELNDRYEKRLSLLEDTADNLRGDLAIKNAELHNAHTELIDARNRIGRLNTFIEHIGSTLDKISTEIKGG